MDVIENKAIGFFKRLTVLLVIVTSIAQFLGVLYWPYDYYVFFRYLSFLVLTVIATISFFHKKLTVVFISMALALLFNPIFPIYLSRSIWFYINLSTGAFLLYIGWLKIKESREANLTIKST